MYTELQLLNGERALQMQTLIINGPKTMKQRYKVMAGGAQSLHKTLHNKKLWYHGGQAIVAMQYQGGVETGQHGASGTLSGPATQADPW